ncbi:hypothetical protein IB260_02165 [Pseudomonas sp. PDM23]|uniref:DUF7832 domain-containing protein n=1 Tax=unclassified Pseudomonas TaxID=196821 RepID=UPI0017861F5D|nr:MULTISPECIES: hypothetical protein [unclassified Pseudomonas]MBD9574100.1 hypothetical protein [Pseudomonas sp. PDM23]MBD9671938.1 hypothetical protein [Pseudomonas sp. PDM21]
MKYDDASWHYEGDFPEDLPPSAAATHIGMFLAWLILNEMVSEELLEDAAEAVAALQSKDMTGARFLIEVLDEKLIGEDLAAHGNAFTIAYYRGLDHDSRYIDDYFETFGVDEEALYSVTDNWDNYAKLSPAIDARYQRWIDDGRPEYMA